MTLKKMTSKDLRDVLLVSGTAFEISDADEQLSEVLHLLEEIFKTGNNNFYFASTSGRSLNLNRVVSRGLERKFLSKFKKYYHKLDPFYKILSFNPPPIVVVRDHSKNKGRLVEYYSDFLKPQSIHHQMSIYLKSKQRFLGVLGLYRPQNANEFSSLDQAKANMMAPYLAGALENAIISEQKTKQAAIIDSITSHMPYKGIIVLDESLELIYQNKHATRFFSHLTPAEKEQRLPSCSLPKEIYSHCKDLLRASPKDEDSETSQKLFEFSCQTKNTKLPIHLRVITYRNKKPLLLLCFSDEGYECNLLKRIRQYGLSQRQAEVVFLLNKGLTNKEIGNKLFISKYTVENHLKSIYEKMDVKNRTELSYRLQQMALTN
ncbi:MAG: LuxR C-terminal-related transcriptional regulator [Desulfobacterales bacterium]|nr:LuxR C-terminal-related transcriptional regulator [Desulfobacterales bacterium]